MRRVVVVEEPDESQESQTPHAKDHFRVASSAVLVGNDFLTKNMTHEYLSLRRHQKGHNTHQTTPQVFNIRVNLLNLPLLVISGRYSLRRLGGR